MTKMGRTQIILDWDKIGKLLEANCKTSDIAAQFGCNVQTIHRRCKSDLGISFVGFSQQKRSSGDNLLRAAQFSAAMNGNTTMQIWLGKQRLGQRDKFEHTGADGGSLIIEIVRRAADAKADAKAEATN